MKLRVEKAVYGGAGLARIPAEEVPANGSAVALCHVLLRGRPSRKA